MKRNKILLLYSLFAGILMLAATGCSDDIEVQETGKRLVHIVPSMGTAPIVDIKTRAADDRRYGNYIPAEQYPIDTEIGLAFYNLSVTPLSTPLVSDFTGTFQYKGFDDVNDIYEWESDVRAASSTRYKVFGHVPADCSTSFVYNFSDDTSTYPENGANPANSITLTGIKPVSNTDVSVIVGVGKDHWKTEDKNGISTGTYDIGGGPVNYYSGAYPCNFEYITSDGQSGTQDVMYLLMDHLFVQTKFYFAIEHKYHELRDIRIKKIYLSAPEIESLNAVVRLNSATQTYNESGSPSTTETTAITGIDWTMTKRASAPATDEGLERAAIYDCTKVQTPTGYYVHPIYGNAYKTTDGKYAYYKNATTWYNSEGEKLNSQPEWKDGDATTEGIQKVAVSYAEMTTVPYVHPTYGNAYKTTDGKYAYYKDATTWYNSEGEKLNSQPEWKDGDATTDGIQKLSVSYAEKALADEQAKGYQLEEVNEDETNWVLVAPGFFSPVKVGEQPMKFRITVEYDVYDKDKLVTRKTTSAMNSYVSSGDSEIKRGTSYEVHITVKPTYLYQLSDNDLDNPTFKLN